MAEVRLPSFNDFSPEILKGDVRPVLQAIADAGGDDAKAIGIWRREYFGGKTNNRSSTNIPATLRSTGLTTGTRPMTLSPVGEAIRAAGSAQEASLLFCSHLIRLKNGRLILEALSSLQKRREKVTKKSLKAELQGLGITGLSTNTTDHTTLKNWMIHSGLLTSDAEPIDSEIKKALGISASEIDAFKSLSLGQQVFLQLLRREHVTSAGPFLGQDLVRACRDNYPHLFDEGQFAKDVREPLVSGGWIKIVGLAKGPQGGKSGKITGTIKLLEIPIDEVSPDFEQVIPSDLRPRLNTPLDEISAELFSDDKYKAGVALELLAVRMIWDLGLSPRHFRLRSAQTGYAEVDLIADGAHLMFSRWTFQCKRYSVGSKVHLSDVAKECGIAVYSKAHVVVMVTTSDFTDDARRFANEVSRATPLQFVFVDGGVVRDYLAKGKSALQSHFQANAQEVMRVKREQSLPLAE